MLPVFKMLLLLCLTFLMKAVEHANRIRPGAPQPTADGTAVSYVVQHAAAIYGVLNLHLSLSIGSLGVIWGNLMVNSAGPSFFAITTLIIVLAMSGSVCRGMISNGEPRTMAWSDWDWRFGVVLPNCCGVASLMFSAAYQAW